MRKAGIVCLLALLAATFGKTPMVYLVVGVNFSPKNYRENWLKNSIFHDKSI
jgi:hypothetical protein